MRTPSESRPWINFAFRVDQLPPKIWVLLGEAHSKCGHISGSPLKPAVANRLAAVYLAKGAHATTAIEGNTLSEEEVRERVEGQGTLPPSREYLGVEVDNIIRALRKIDQHLQEGTMPPLDKHRLLDLHAQVLEGIYNPPQDEPGVLRRHNVGVNRYSGPAFQEVDGLVESLVEWLDSLAPPLEASPSDRFVSAVLRAILAHLYIAWIHPFGNGNGRTARLVEVQILASSGLVPIVATNLLSDHYNKTRTRYYEMLDRASRADDVFGFVQYALEGLVDELRSQVQVVKRHNMHIAWESYVYEVFNACVPSTARSRQRQVALALPGNRYLRKDEIIELNTRIAREYARCGERTPARDLNELHRLGLVERQGRTFRSTKEIILAFRPPVGGSLLLDGSEDL